MIEFKWLIFACLWMKKPPALYIAHVPEEGALAMKRHPQKATLTVVKQTKREKLLAKLRAGKLIPKTPTQLFNLLTARDYPTAATEAGAASLAEKALAVWKSHEAKTAVDRAKLGEMFFVLRNVNGTLDGGFQAWTKKHGVSRATAYRYIADYVASKLGTYARKPRKLSPEVMQNLFSKGVFTLVRNLHASGMGYSQIMDNLTGIVEANVNAARGHKKRPVSVTPAAKPVVKHAAQRLAA
jgi:hypothetical protein